MGMILEKGPLDLFLNRSIILQENRADLSVTKYNEGFLLYKLFVKAADIQLSGLPDNMISIYTSNHPAESFYLSLARGRLEEVGYEVMKGMDDMKPESNIFPEMMSFLVCGRYSKSSGAH